MTWTVHLVDEGKGFFQFDTNLNSKNISKACKETSKLSTVVTLVPGLEFAHRL